MNKSDLIRGRWYIGEGRFIGGIALWGGEFFTGYQLAFGEYLPTWADFGEKGFSPKGELIL